MCRINFMYVNSIFIFWKRIGTQKLNKEFLVVSLHTVNILNPVNENLLSNHKLYNFFSENPSPSQLIIHFWKTQCSHIPVGLSSRVKEVTIATRVRQGSSNELSSGKPLSGYKKKKRKVIHKRLRFLRLR